MSWHCSRALVAEYSAANCSDGELSAPSSSTPTPEAFYWPDKTTEHSRLSRFGMTSEPLTADRGAALLTWFLAGSRAKTSALQEKATGWTASEVGSGRKWLGLLARYDRDSFTWRTPQCSLVEGLDEFSETWPRWGSMRNGECWERETWERPTSESESGFWPTPTVCGNYNRPGASATSGMGLASAVKLWPTPVADDTGSRKKRYAQGGTQLSLAVKMWPTPTACASKGSSPAALVRKSGRSRENDRIDHAVMASDGGPLNPDWVEWLMGWPIGWTDLKPLETAKSAEWRQQHGACSGELE